MVNDRRLVRMRSDTALVGGAWQGWRPTFMRNHITAVHRLSRPLWVIIRMDCGKVVSRQDQRWIGGNAHGLRQNGFLISIYGEGVVGAEDRRGHMYSSFLISGLDTE